MGPAITGGWGAGQVLGEITDIPCTPTTGAVRRAMAVSRLLRRRYMVVVVDGEDGGDEVACVCVMRLSGDMSEAECPVVRGGKSR